MHRAIRILFIVLFFPLCVIQFILSIIIYIPIYRAIDYINYSKAIAKQDIFDKNVASHDIKSYYGYFAIKPIDDGFARYFIEALDMDYSYIFHVFTMPNIEYFFTMLRMPFLLKNMHNKMNYTDVIRRYQLHIGTPSNISSIYVIEKFTDGIDVARFIAYPNTYNLSACIVNNCVPLNALCILRRNIITSDSDFTKQIINDLIHITNNQINAPYTIPETLCNENQLLQLMTKKKNDVDADNDKYTIGAADTIPTGPEIVAADTIPNPDLGSVKLDLPEDLNVINQIYFTNSKHCRDHDVHSAPPSNRADTPIDENIRIATDTARVIAGLSVALYTSMQLKLKTHNAQPLLERLIFHS